MTAARLVRVDRLLRALARLMAAERRRIEALEQERIGLEAAEQAARSAYDRCGALTDVAATGLTRLLQRLWNERARVESAWAAAAARLARLEVTERRLRLKRRMLAEQAARKAMEQEVAEWVGQRRFSAQG